MITPDYSPVQPFYSYGENPELALMIAEASGKAPVEAMYPAQQQAPVLAERLSPMRLFNMYEAWEQAKQDENYEMWIASRYYHSKQWTDSEIRELKRRKQPVTTKNRIKRKVDFLIGVEQRLRRDPKCYPVTPSAEQAAGVATACLRSIQDENKWPSLASAATHDALIRGIGVTWQGAKVVKQRAEVRKHWVPGDRFFYDPRSEMHDFSDARYLGEWQWLDIDEAVEILPFAAERIEDLANSGRGGAWSVLPQEFDKDKNWNTWIDYRERRIRLVSIWYKYKGMWLYDYLVGPISLCGPEFDCVSPYEGIDEPTAHPYSAWSPYIDERGVRYGVVRDMIPIQDEINKRSSKMLYMLSVRQTMGAKGAIDDIDLMKLEGAKPDGHIEYNPGLEFQFVDQTVQTQGQMELLQEAKAEIENLGPNPGLIGRGVENQSGRAILAQQNSGMTELSPVFERLRDWKLASFRKDWSLAQQFWTGERYVRVSGDPRAVEFLAINRLVEDPMTGQLRMENMLAEMDVDVLLDEGPDTITMREELLEQLAQLGPNVIPPELLIELSSIPEKDMILKRMQEFKAPPPELTELQSKMARLEELIKAANIDKLQAETENKRAATLKTLSETVAPPQALSQMFPVHYREPSFLDQAGQPQQPPMGPPPNAMQGPMGMPQGAQGMPEFGAPNMPDPMMGQEPSINDPGGLPLGPGVE